MVQIAAVRSNSPQVAPLTSPCRVAMSATSSAASCSVGAASEFHTLSRALLTTV